MEFLTFVLFKYIQCYYSTVQLCLNMPLSGYLNTSNVIIQRSMYDTYEVVKRNLNTSNVIIQRKLTKQHAYLKGYLNTSNVIIQRTYG